MHVRLDIKSNKLKHDPAIQDLYIILDKMIQNLRVS